MFRLDSHANCATNEILEARNIHEKPKHHRRMNRSRVMQNTVKHSMRKDLKRLCASNGLLAVLLHLLEVMWSQRVRLQCFSKNVGCCNRVL